MHLCELAISRHPTPVLVILCVFLARHIWRNSLFVLFCARSASYSFLLAILASISLPIQLSVPRLWNNHASLPTLSSFHFRHSSVSRSNVFSAIAFLPWLMWCYFTGYFPHPHFAGFLQKYALLLFRIPWDFPTRWYVLIVSAPFFPPFDHFCISSLLRDNLCDSPYFAFFIATPRLLRIHLFPC